MRSPRTTRRLTVVFLGLAALAAFAWWRAFATSLDFEAWLLARDIRSVAMTAVDAHADELAALLGRWSEKARRVEERLARAGQDPPQELLVSIAGEEQVAGIAILDVGRKVVASVLRRAARAPSATDTAALDEWQRRDAEYWAKALRPEVGQGKAANLWFAAFGNEYEYPGSPSFVLGSKDGGVIYLRPDEGDVAGLVQRFGVQPMLVRAHKEHGADVAVYAIEPTWDPPGTVRMKGGTMTITPPDASSSAQFTLPDGLSAVASVSFSLTPEARAARGHAAELWGFAAGALSLMLVGVGLGLLIERRKAKRSGSAPVPDIGAFD